MLKIDKDEDYFTLCTIDFVSLQMVLASQDECLNDTGVDPIMLEIYGAGGHNDAHSTTSMGTFGKPINLEVLEFADSETGKTWSCVPQQWMKIKRDGKSIEVAARDIRETDSIIDRIDKQSSKIV
jgi:hypothetical protein